MARRWMPMALGIAVLASTALGLTVALDPDAAARAGASVADVVPGAPPTPATVTISPAANATLDPSSPITVQATGGVLRAVHVTNSATGKAVDGRLAPDGTAWSSTGDRATPTPTRSGWTASGGTGRPRTGTTPSGPSTPRRRRIPR